nr:TetR-like C-terminal domain-containing protein [Streptomyces sp. SID11385]
MTGRPAQGQRPRAESGFAPRPEAARALHESLLAQEDLGVFVARAVARGELPGTPEATPFLPQLFFAGCFTRPLFENAYADEEYIVEFIDSVILPVLKYRP